MELSTHALKKDLKVYMPVKLSHLTKCMNQQNQRNILCKKLRSFKKQNIQISFNSMKSSEQSRITILLWSFATEELLDNSLPKHNANQTLKKQF